MKEKQILRTKAILDLLEEAELYYPENGLTDIHKKRLCKFARLICKYLESNSNQKENIPCKAPLNE